MPSSNDLIKLAEKHKGERYVLGARVPMSNSKWNGPWDCAEFVSWCTYQITGKLFGCRPNDGNPDAADAYTGYWANDAKIYKTGVPWEDAAGMPGALLLREPRAGSIGHIVISKGDGSTIEAMGARYGVTNGTVSGRRWDYGILVPDVISVHSSVELDLELPSTVLYLTEPYMSGPLVKSVQRALKALGYSPGPIDGTYGPQTAAAVQAFQADKKLVPDAEVGIKTAKALKIPWP